jgi:Glycosyl hydrolase catalytic core
MLRRLLPVLVMVAALGAAPAQAAQREVPRGWLGMDVDGPLMEGAHGTPEGEWDLIAQSGAESVRMAMQWPLLQPHAGKPPDLTTTDALVLAAARRGMTFLPVVQGTPKWAARYPSKGHASPPRNVATYAKFLRVLIARYGRDGSLWAEHPEVQALPIRDWQIWNEPNFREYWSKQPFGESFVPLLRAAYRAVHRADRGGRVILAGMANHSWAGLERLYRAGGQGTFDAVALHPFTMKPANVIRLIEMARDVMGRYGDRRLPIWVTELSFPAAKGKVDKPRGLETTQAGQVKRLRASVMQLAEQRRRLRVERVFWYAWLTYETRTSSFSWSGLRRFRDGTVVSTSSLEAYQRVAQRLQGCAKVLGDARRCA